MPDTEEQQLMDEVRRLHADSAAWAEGLHLEFKLSESKVPKDLWETYSAFANTKGGVVLLGVQNDGTVKGITDPEKQLKDLVNTLNDEGKVSINLCKEPGCICAMKLEGKDVIALRVPEAETRHKPVYLNGRINVCHLRVNEADIECRKEDIAQMLRDAETVVYKPEFMPYTSMADVDGATLKQYRNMMRSYSPQHPWVRMDDEMLLRRLSAYTTDAATGQDGLTLEGLLMFGTEEAIIRHMPQLQLNYFEYDTTETADFLNGWTDRICNDGTWVPNLYQFFFRVLPRIQQRLKNPFKLRANLTAQGDSNAHIAVREALANAVVHADYRGEGGITIRQYPHGLRFENPGTLLLPKELVMQGGISRCRNCGLQTMFMRMGIVEKAGSGIDRMMRGWEEQCMMPPRVEEEQRPARVVWEMPFVGILPKDNEERIRIFFGAKLYFSLTPLQRIVLWIISEKEQTSHKQIHRLLPYVHAADLSACLSRLVSIGCLERTGRTTASSYRFVAEYQGRYWAVDTADAAIGSSGDKEKKAPVIAGASSGDKGEKAPVITGARSGDKGGKAPVITGASSGDKGGLPLILSDEVQQKIAALRPCQRLSPELLDELVLQICKGNWVTLPQLAHLLDRTPDYLRRRCLQSLVRHGLLQMKDPQKPTHPKQAYTAAQREE